MHALTLLTGIGYCLLESNRGSYPAAPPLVLKHKLPCKPIQLLQISSFTNSFPREQHWLHILLLQHCLSCIHKHFHIAGTWVRVCIYSRTSPHAGTISLPIHNQIHDKVVANFAQVTAKLWAMSYELWAIKKKPRPRVVLKPDSIVY